MRDVNAVVLHALPVDRIDGLLADVTASYGRIILGIEDDDTQDSSPQQAQDHSQHEADVSMVSEDARKPFQINYRKCSNMTADAISAEEIEETASMAAARASLLELLRRLHATGLGGSRAQKTFASVLHDLMTRFVEWAYRGEYDGSIDAVSHIRCWVENVFSRFVVQILDIMQVSEDSPAVDQASIIGLSDVRKWQDMAVSRLGVLRVDELFDIIIDWNRSQNALDDLKHFITTPATRNYLTTNFTNVLASRLLQPGASTIEILQIYISIIKAFRTLDPKGVLLDRVARPIRKYLRERDDTVKVIVSGVMSDNSAENDEPNPDILSELAIELKENNIDNRADDEGDLDWNNMDWVPDPIDAAPDYQKSKASDVIGTLISLFETNETFIKELQAQLADRLLDKLHHDYDHEISIIEHLKLRFGDTALQACEVMLRDVVDSRRVNTVIRHDQDMNTNTPEFNVKILSRLFWPQLQDITYIVPPEIVALQSRYSKGYESIKQSRKLTWHDSAGHVQIELEFEDRTFSEFVAPWQAAVILQFQSDPPAPRDIYPVAPPHAKEPG